MPDILSEQQLSEIEATLIERFPHIGLYAPDSEPLLCVECCGAVDDHKANCVVPDIHQVCRSHRALAAERDREYLRGRKEAIDENLAHWQGIVDRFRLKAVEAVKARVKALAKETTDMGFTKERFNDRDLVAAEMDAVNKIADLLQSLESE